MYTSCAYLESSLKRKPPRLPLKWRAAGGPRMIAAAALFRTSSEIKGDSFKENAMAGALSKLASSEGVIQIVLLSIFSVSTKDPTRSIYSLMYGLFSASPSSMLATDALPTDALSIEAKSANE